MVVTVVRRDGDIRVGSHGNREINDQAFLEGAEVIVVVHPDDILVFRVLRLDGAFTGDHIREREATIYLLPMETEGDVAGLFGHVHQFEAEQGAEVLEGQAAVRRIGGNHGNGSLIEGHL